jgi:hypothetical protein
VADEIPYCRAADDNNPTAPAYAEVQNDNNDVRNKQSFPYSKPNNSINVDSVPGRRPQVEHIYSEPNETVCKPVYDVLQHNRPVQAANQKLPIHAKHLQKGRNLPTKDGNARMSSPAVVGPYASCDIVSKQNYSNTNTTAVHAPAPLSQRFESDDSLILTDNEIYEPFQSANV